MILWPDGECRYKKGPWSDCDPNSNMQRKSLTLKRGDSTCEQTKVMSRKCKTGNIAKQLKL